MINNYAEYACITDQTKMKNELIINVDDVNLQIQVETSLRNRIKMALAIIVLEEVNFINDEPVIINLK